MIVYGPTDDADCKIKYDFYKYLTEVLSDVDSRKDFYLIGDFNGRTGGGGRK